MSWLVSSVRVWVIWLECAVEASCTRPKASRRGDSDSPSHWPSGAAGALGSVE